MNFDLSIWKALIAAITLALISAPLGCITVWKGMTRFGETFAHVALLGAAISILSGMLPEVGMLGVVMVLALVLPILVARTRIPLDTLLGILAPSGIALAILLVKQSDIVIDFEALLFGELRAVEGGDILWILGGATIILLTIACLWQPILLSVLSRDLARSENIPVTILDSVLTAILGMFIVLGVKIAGLLLVNAFLVVPSACIALLARQSKKLQSPERMAWGTLVLNCLCVGVGFAIAILADLPAGAAICATLFLVFCAIAMTTR